MVNGTSDSDLSGPTCRFVFGESIVDAGHADWFSVRSCCSHLKIDSLGQRSANYLSRGAKNETISLGGPQLLSKEKHSAHFNVVLLYLNKNYIPVNKRRLQ